MRRTLHLAIAILCVTACSAGCAKTPASFLATFNLETAPRPERFTICTAFACAAQAATGLSQEEWARVRDLFAPPPRDAAAERQAAARAVGLLEALAGAKTGTGQDRPRNETGADDWGQLDCVAEAANTTVYLLLLEKEGLLPRHRTAHPAHRGVFIILPHNTAVLEETERGEAYALDSWYGAGGEAARVWPLADWERWRTDADRPGQGPGRLER